MSRMISLGRMEKQVADMLEWRLGETRAQKRARKKAEAAAQIAAEAAARAINKRRARQLKYVHKRRDEARAVAKVKQQQERRLLKTDSPAERAVKLRRRRQRVYLARKQKAIAQAARDERKRVRDEKHAKAVAATQERAARKEKQRIRGLGYDDGFVRAYQDITARKERLAVDEQKPYSRKWRVGTCRAKLNSTT
jgi:hypothetical protein